LLMWVFVFLFLTHPFYALRNWTLINMFRTSRFWLSGEMLRQHLYLYHLLWLHLNSNHWDYLLALEKKKQECQHFLADFPLHLFIEWLVDLQSLRFRDLQFWALVSTHSKQIILIDRFLQIFQEPLHQWCFLISCIFSSVWSILYHRHREVISCSKYQLREKLKDLVRRWW